MAKIRPSLRSTATFTETNFLRLHAAGGNPADSLVTLEHFAYSASSGDQPGWSCRTIVDAEKMSRADGVFIAQRYATENGIPVIYEE
jgi:hypothetical protein